MVEGPGEARSKLPERDVMVLTELEQIKVAADPLRIRILEELLEERTTKQVAERLGERPTKLYHHVDALEKAGLIVLTRTQPNRGTLEKYYQAVARTFRADASAFSAGERTDEEKDTMRQVVDTIFESTAREINALLDAGGGESIEKEGLLSYVEIRAGEQEIAELQRRLEGILEWLTKLAENTSENDVESYPRRRLTLAFFPLEPPEGGSETR